MISWYRAKGSSELLAWTRRPDLWPPGWEVWLDGLESLEGSALVADFGSDNSGLQVESAESWPDFGGPGVVEALVLAGAEVWVTDRTMVASWESWEPPG